MINLRAYKQTQTQPWSLRRGGGGEKLEEVERGMDASIRFSCRAEIHIIANGRCHTKLKSETSQIGINYASRIPKFSHAAIALKRCLLQKLYILLL